MQYAKYRRNFLFQLVDLAFFVGYLCRMKILFLSFLFTFLFVSLYAQTDDRGAAYAKFWSESDAEFRNPETSPLPKTDIWDFDSIPRYNYSSEYRVLARWEPVVRQKPFKIEASGDRRDTYQKVANIHFVLNGDSLKLAAYQNLDLMRNQEYRDYIFVPFLDETNGFETYGGGRYLDFSQPQSDSLIVDFNLAYNPYCAYSHAYSCPIPPTENTLKVKIKAGARMK